MNINLAVLVSELRKYYHVRCSDICDRCVNNIKLLEDHPSKESFEGDKLNVFRLRSLSLFAEIPSNMPVLCIAHPDSLNITEKSVMGSGTYIIVYADKLEKVLMTLSGILYKCGQMSSPLEDMTRELLPCRTLEQVLTVGYRWLKNPLIIADSQHEVLAHTDSEFVSFLKYEDMWTRESIFPSRSSINSTIHAMDTSMRTYWPSDVEATEEGPNFLCKTLCTSGRVDGFLFLYIVEQDRVEHTEEMLELLGNFCAVLLREQISLQIAPKRKQDPLGIVLNMLLDEEEVTRNQMEKHIERLQLHSKPYRYILSVQPTNEVPTDFHPVHGLIDILTAAVPHAMGTYYRNKLTILIESSIEIRDFSTAWEPLGKLLKEYGFRAGISNVCRDIMDLKEYFQQAVQAVQTASVYFPEQVLIPYYLTAPYHMLELAASRQNLLHLCDPGVLRLQSLDKRNDTDLLHTLRIYLECGRNKAQTAQRMYLHLNTVKYRINQISEVVDLQCSCLEDELRLYLSIVILRYLNQLPESPGIKKKA